MTFDFNKHIPMPYLKQCIDYETGLMMSSCGKRCAHNFSEKTIQKEGSS